jgi:hypothetical protein
VPEARVEVRGRAAEQALAARRQALRRLGHIVEHAVVEAPVERQEVARAVAEVMQQAALRYLGLRHHQVERQPSEPGPLGDAETRVEERLAHALGVPRATGHRAGAYA